MVAGLHGSWARTLPCSTLVVLALCMGGEAAGRHTAQVRVGFLRNCFFRNLMGPMIKVRPQKASVAKLRETDLFFLNLL